MHVDDQCVAAGNALTGAMLPLDNTKGVTTWHIRDAIERADEAGFWTFWTVAVSCMPTGSVDFDCNEVTVDVPVADNAALPVIVEEDES